MNGADSRWNNRLWACGLTARRIMPGTVRLGVLSGLRNSTRRNSARAIRSGAIQPKTIGLAQFGPKQLARHYSVCAIRSGAIQPGALCPGVFSAPFSGCVRALRFLPAGGQQCQTEREQNLPRKQGGITVHNGCSAYHRRPRRHKKSAPKIQAQGLNADSENQHQAPGP